MAAFRYQARESGGAAVSGLIEAETRQEALCLLSERGLFPSNLEACATVSSPLGPPKGTVARASLIAAGGRAEERDAPAAGGARGGRIRRKEITSFTREMATLLSATIPIPAALESLGEEETNPALSDVILGLAASVRTGNALSAALEAHPRLFSKLYTSMVRVGEEAGALEKVMGDLADLMEHEDELRGEVWGAVAYPCFVLGLGLVTTFLLLAFVMPRLFGMLKGMLQVLPLPTRILLAVSNFFQAYWPWTIAGAVGAVLFLRWYLRSPAGGLLWDTAKLRLPVVGAVFRSSALSRFARTLGTLTRSGVSLLPALEIVRHTIGNRLLCQAIGKVAEETRGGDPLAAPLRRLGLFPPTVVQMVAVGEETGRLDDMLLRVAGAEERHMRGRSRTLISLLAPALILLVGALVGFVVIALLLPIFRMSQVLR